MLEVVHHEKLGQIIYEENAWTGKKQLTVNGTKLTMQQKNTFIWNCDGQNKTILVKGSFVTGAKLLVDGMEIRLTDPVKWYEVLCSILLPVLIMVWGNSVYLCRIVPVIGGAIGGGISGGMAFLNLTMMKMQDKIGLKLAIWLAMMILNFGICFVVAKIFLAII